MKQKITALFLLIGIIIYANFLNSGFVSNILLSSLCICMLIMLRERDKRTNQLFDSHSELLKLINTIPMPAFIKDCDCNIFVANKEFFNLFKIDESTDYKMLTNLVYSNLELKEIKAEEENLKTNETYIKSERLVKISNEIKKYYLSKAGIYNTAKKLTNIVVFVKNVEIESDNCTNEDMIATLTHDLKTPAVAQIRGIELLLNGYFGEINERQRSFLTDILESGNNMLAMLIDMLWLYKFDNKKINLNITSFDVNELIREILKENRLVLNIKNTRFVQKNKTARVHIIADKSHIKRIIHNILMNALNYGRENSNIYINTKIEENAFIFEVENEGKHIDKNLLKCINDRNSIFTQKTQGLSTGLGLYLSNALLGINGGKFICESSAEGINKFGFSIKLSSEAEKQNKSADIKSAI